MTVSIEEALGVQPGKGPSEYKFYNNAFSLFYDDEGHTYFRFDREGNTIIVPGVTTAIHIIDKSGALIQWAANMATDFIRTKIEAEKVLYANVGDSLLDALNGGEPTILASVIESWLDEARFAHSKYKEDAADTGKIAHDFVERFIRATIAKDAELQHEILNNPPEDERARNGATAAFDWMKRHNVRWLFTERKIYHRKFDYAGTADGAAYIDSCGDAECCGRLNPETGEKELLVFKDALALIDWKTSNRLYEEYEYQTAAYDAALEDEQDLHFEYRVLIRLGKEDAQFESKILFNEDKARDFRTFLKCLSLYREIDGRKRQERAVRDSVKAILKAKKEADKEAEKQRKREAKAALKADKESLFETFRSQGMSIKKAREAVRDHYASWDNSDDEVMEEAA